jgi:anti-sigma B factor antagonist
MTPASVPRARAPSSPIPQPEGFSCRVGYAGDVARVTVRGELDVVTAAPLDAALTGAERRAATVMLDLTGVRFIDCSGVRPLITAERRIRARGGHFILDVPEVISRLLVLVGVDDVFERAAVPAGSTRPVLRLVSSPTSTH